MVFTSSIRVKVASSFKSNLPRLLYFVVVYKYASVVAAMSAIMLGLSVILKSALANNYVFLFSLEKKQ